MKNRFAKKFPYRSDAAKDDALLNAVWFQAAPAIFISVLAWL